MKRIISIFLVLLTLAVPLTACRTPRGDGMQTYPASETEAETTGTPAGCALPVDCVLPGKNDPVTFNNCCDTEWNGYMIGFGDVLTGRNTIPLKYNLSSGTLTPVCVDPLCNHELNIGNCPFSYAVNTIGVWNGRLYIVRNWADKDMNTGSFTYINSTLSSYDMTDGILHDYWEISFPFPSDEEYEKQGSAYRDNTQKMQVFWMYGAYIFTTRYYPICDEPVSIEDYHQWLVCINADTGVFTQLVNLTEKGVDFEQIFCVRNGCVYYLDSRKDFCELDLNTQSYRVVIPYESDGWTLRYYNSYSGFIDNCFWYGEVSNDLGIFRVKRFSMSDGTAETVTEFSNSGMFGFTICGDSIFRFIRGEKIPDSRYYVFRIIRCNLDGSGEEEVSSFEALSMFSVDPCENNQKLYISLQQSERCLVYDIRSGEFTSVKPLK